jgi:hypothetical protein
MSFIDDIKKTTGTVGKVIKETYGPLAALEQQYVPAQFRYPLDVGNTQRYPHTVEFQTWLPESVSITDMGVAKSVGGAATQASNFTKRIINSGVQQYNQARALASKYTLGATDLITPGANFSPLAETPYAPEPEEWLANDMKVTRNKRYNDRMMDFTRRASRSDLITLYMPATTWQDQVNNEYQQASMTAALGNAGLMVEAASSVIKESDFWANEGGEGFWSKAADMANGPAGMEVISKVAGNFGMDAGIVRDAGLTAMGYALNPQFEMLYQGTNMREFQFEFNMTPRSREEAEIIRKICHKFKYHASPAYVSGQGRYIVPPSYFDITFKFNGSDSEWLPQISTCVLKSVNIDYGGGLDQWATHADGSPIQTKIVLIFTELEMMHKSLRKKGY